jgi:hypothetical protein
MAETKREGRDMKISFYTAGTIDGDQTLFEVHSFPHVGAWSAAAVDGSDDERNIIGDTIVAENYHDLMEKMDTYHRSNT